MSTHVTYLRPGDRTRIVFVLDLPEHEALAKAAELAPQRFHHVATRTDQHGPMRVPEDGDDYGNPSAKYTTGPPWSDERRVVDPLNDPMPWEQAA